MDGYRGKHTASQPWAVASTASVRTRGRHQQKNRRRRRGLVMLLILLLLLLLYPFLEAHLLTTDRHLLSSENLPVDIGHLRVVYLSDIHYGFGFTDIDLNNLVSRINQLKPDLVLFGGGYATDNASAVSFFQRLPAIHARYAILGVLGETDRGDTPFDQTHLTDAMRSAGVTPLINDVVPVRIGNSIVYIAGLDDPTTGTPDLKSMASRVSASDYVIFLCHNPSVIPSAQTATDADGRLGWFDLGLFGHTHGGQLGPFSSMLSLAEDVPSRYLSGWLTENRVELLVSRGVGTSGIPARFLCLPQIHDIEISLN